MGVNGRKKGSTFELAVAKFFADWTGDTVRRTPQSGGWSREEQFDVSGDLVFLRTRTLHVECKNQEGWRLEDLLTGANAGTKIEAWWKQATEECPPHKYPLLVFTRNHLPAFVMRRYGKAPSSLKRSGEPRAQAFVLRDGRVVQKLDDFLAEFLPPPMEEERVEPAPRSKKLVPKMGKLLHRKK